MIQMLRPWLRVPDAILVIPLLLALGLGGIVMASATAPLRAIWRRRCRRRGRDMPRSLLILSYNTYDEALAKGIMTDPNLWYNCGERFESVLVYVALAPSFRQIQLTNRIQYRQDGMPFGEWGYLFAWTMLIFRFLRGWLRASVLALDADVMLVNGPNRSAQIGIVPKVLTGIPTLVFIEAFWEEILPQQNYMSRGQKLLLPAWFRLVYRMFDGYNGAPTYAIDAYAARGMSRTAIYPYVNNVDVAALSAGCAAVDLPSALAGRERPWVITVGRLHVEKKSRDVIELQARLARRGLPGTGILVGDGEARTELETLARSLGVSDRVLFLGQMSQTEGMAVVKACDFCFAPMQGNAIIEAMAAGCCIVAYDNESHRIFVEHGRTAVLVREGDVDEAAAKIGELIADTSQAAHLRSEARVTSLDRYTPHNIADTWYAPFIAIYRAAKR